MMGFLGPPTPPNSPSLSVSLPTLQQLEQELEQENLLPDTDDENSVGS